MCPNDVFPGIVNLRRAACNLQTIGESAFAECEGLQHVAIPDGATVIHGCAFWGCSNLRTVELPATLPLARPLGAKDPDAPWASNGRVFAGCTLLKKTIENQCNGNYFQNSK